MGTDMIGFQRAAHRGYGLLSDQGVSATIDFRALFSQTSEKARMYG